MRVRTTIPTTTGAITTVLERGREGERRKIKEGEREREGEKSAWREGGREGERERGRSKGKRERESERELNVFMFRVCMMHR